MGDVEVRIIRIQCSNWIGFYFENARLFVREKVGFKVKNGKVFYFENQFKLSLRYELSCSDLSFHSGATFDLKILIMIFFLNK